MKVDALVFICSFWQFFEMPRHEAVKALEIYRRAGQQVMQLIFLEFPMFVLLYKIYLYC